jgi:AcrR family transcriptional regulator
MVRIKKQSALPSSENEKSKKTKELIYTTAISLFQEVGFEEATMRMIASKAGVALGSAYYYFQTKEDIVLHFYQISQEYAKKNSEAYCQSNKDFKLRIKNIILFRIEYFSNYQKFISVLAKRAGDPNHRLSPFSEETSGVRIEAIQIIREAMETSNQKLPKEVALHLPELLWLYQMGILYFWIYDSNKTGNRHLLVIDESLDLVFRFIKISSLPLLKSLFGSLFKLIRLIRDGG